MGGGRRLRVSALHPNCPTSRREATTFSNTKLHELQRYICQSRVVMERRQRPASASSKLGPPPNWIIEETRVHGEQVKHSAAVASVTAAVDNKAPLRPNHVINRGQTKAQRCKAQNYSLHFLLVHDISCAVRAAEVKRDNAILVHKLHTIMQKPPQHDDPRTVNLYGTRRKLVTSKVARENNVSMVALSISAFPPTLPYSKCTVGSQLSNHSIRTKRLKTMRVSMHSECNELVESALWVCDPSSRHSPSQLTQ
jgi:hypothetical protein